MKSIMMCLRSFVLAPFILYIFNMMAVGLNLYIPINLFTILMVGFLEIPGLLTLIFFWYFIF